MCFHNGIPDFQSNGMQSVCQHKHIKNLSPYIMSHFFYPGNFIQPHTGTGHGNFALVTYSDLLGSYHGEGVCVVALRSFVGKYSLCFILCFGR